MYISSSNQVDMIQEQVPADQQYLTFFGKPLDDSSSVDSYALCSDNTIHLHSRLLGGQNGKELKPKFETNYQCTLSKQYSGIFPLFALNSLLLRVFDPIHFHGFNCENTILRKASLLKMLLYEVIINCEMRNILKMHLRVYEYTVKLVLSVNV